MGNTGTVAKKSIREKKYFKNNTQEDTPSRSKEKLNM